MFQDRKDAGNRLAAALAKYSGDDVIVLGIPRGGVEIAYYVALHLHAELSVIVCRKLGYPDEPEAAFGAITEDGNIYLSPNASTLSKHEIDDVLAAEKKELSRRIKILRRGKPLPPLTDRTVILVDDGIATGATMFVAISFCMHMRPRRLVAAAPVADAAMKAQLQNLADDVIIIETPQHLYAIGEYYERFENLTDAQTLLFLERFSSHKKQR